MRGDGCRGEGGEERSARHRRATALREAGDVTGTDVGGGGEWRLRRGRGVRERKRGEELHALLGAVDEERERRRHEGSAGGNTAGVLIHKVA